MTLVALACIASSAGAQQLVAFGAAEFSGQRRSVQLLGLSASSGGPGWSPVVTVTGLRFTFPVFPPGGGTETADAFAIAPSVGLRYQTETGSTGVNVGYIWVDEDEITEVTGSPVGAADGVFASLQADYWGRGDRIGQLIASYNFGGEYLWSRAKGGVRVGGLTTWPLFAGAEVIFQGGGGDEDATPPIPDTWALQAGPVLMFQFTPSFRLDLSGGVRVPIDDPGDEDVGGYVRIEFVAVLPRLFR